MTNERRRQGQPGLSVTGESGVALIIVILVGTLVFVVGLGLLLMLGIGQLVVRNHREAATLQAAAEAGIDLAADGLATDDWQVVLAGGAVAASADGAPAGVRTVDGHVIRLDEETNLLNCAARTPCGPAERASNTSERPWGANNPFWRLYLFGPLRSLASLTHAPPVYLMVWIGDDGRETDGRPETDGGDPAGRHVVRAHAAAVGRDGARRAVTAELMRICLEGRATCEPGIRVQSVRDRRHALP